MDPLRLRPDPSGRGDRGVCRNKGGAFFMEKYFHQPAVYCGKYRILFVRNILKFDVHPQSPFDTEN